MAALRPWILLLLLSFSRDDFFVVAFVTPAHSIRHEILSVHHVPSFTRTSTSLCAKREYKPSKTRWRSPSTFFHSMRRIPLTLFALFTVFLSFRTSASAVSTTTVSRASTKVNRHQNVKTFEDKTQQKIDEAIEAGETFENIYEEKKTQRTAERKKLLYQLIQDGICPFVDVEGERQIYLFDHFQDLNHIPFSAQQRELSLMKDPKWRERRKKQRYAIKCIAEDIRLQGKDPLSYLEMHQDQTRKIFDLSDRSLDVIVKRYKHLFKTQGNLSGSMADPPFDVNKAIMDQSLSRTEETVNQNIRSSAFKGVSLAKNDSKIGTNVKRHFIKDYSKRKPTKYYLVGAFGAVGYGIYRMEIERTKKEILKIKNSSDMNESYPSIDDDAPFYEQVEEDNIHDSQNNSVSDINGDSMNDERQQQESYILYQQWVKENTNNTDVTLYKDDDSKDGEAYALYQKWAQDQQTSNEGIGDELKSENAFEEVARLKDEMSSQIYEPENDSLNSENRYESYALYQQWVQEHENKTGVFYEEGGPINGEAYELYQQWVQDLKIPDEVTKDDGNIKADHLDEVMLSPSKENFKDGLIIANNTNSNLYTYVDKDVEKVTAAISNIEVNSSITMPERNVSTAHRYDAMLSISDEYEENSKRGDIAIDKEVENDRTEINNIEFNRFDMERKNSLEEIKSNVRDLKSLSRTVQNMISGKSISGRKGKQSLLWLKYMFT